MQMMREIWRYGNIETWRCGDAHARVRSQTLDARRVKGRGEMER